MMTIDDIRKWMAHMDANGDYEDATAEQLKDILCDWVLDMKKIPDKSTHDWSLIRTMGNMIVALAK